MEGDLRNKQALIPFRWLLQIFSQRVVESAAEPLAHQPVLHLQFSRNASQLQLFIAQNTQVLLPLQVYNQRS